MSLNNMNKHPIADLFNISLDRIKEMIDVNTICGDAIQINDEVGVIPISKVSCVFATGGCEQNHVNAATNTDKNYPFGGATGGTVTLRPIAFLVCQKDEVKLLHLDEHVHLYEKLIEEIPQFIADIKRVFMKAPNVTNLEIIEKKQDHY